MNELQKFRDTVEEIKDDIETVLLILENGCSANPDNTVSHIVELYEDTADRLKEAFEELKEGIGDKLVVELKDYGKEDSSQ